MCECLQDVNGERFCSIIIEENIVRFSKFAHNFASIFCRFRWIYKRVVLENKIKFSKPNLKLFAFILAHLIEIYQRDEIERSHATQLPESKSNALWQLISHITKIMHWICKAIPHWSIHNVRIK